MRGDLLPQLTVGLGVCLVNIAVHALVMTAVVRAARSAALSYGGRPNFFIIAVMVTAVSILMGAHLAEVLVWTVAYTLVNAAPNDADAMYFAFVNYTTLGYGDITPAPGWKLLGPITAMNGVLLFGWSTAVIFEILRSAMSKQRSETDGSTSRKPR
jgi:hypothetical protein